MRDFDPPSLPPLSRRALVKASLSVGFCAAIAPVCAQTIATSTDGLIAGEVKVRRRRRRHSRLSRHARGRRAVPDRGGRA